MMTKKLARIEPHSSLRTLVIFASTISPAMSKRRLSPSFRPRRSMMLFSTDASARPGASLNHAPSTTSFPSGSALVVDRLNSRLARRRASPSAKVSLLMAAPLIAVRRPRIIGNSTGSFTLAACSWSSTPFVCSGRMLITKRFGASAGVADCQAAIRSPRTTVRSSSAIRPSDSDTTCTTVAPGRRCSDVTAKRQACCGNRLRMRRSSLRPSQATSANTAKPPRKPPAVISASVRSPACQ